MALRIAERFSPEQVILFGSHARGHPRQDSDVDLLVVMETGLDLPHRIMQVAPIARVPLVPMHLLVLTPGEVSERLIRGDDFIREVMEHGKVLYGRDSGS